MANLKLNHIYKVYPNGVKAVNDFTMDIEDKEFIVFVGPSGCGKSTTLRMIAGLEEISAGELRISDNVVNDVEPKDRDIAMVFQNYALYPHMTVYNNMAFSLKLRKTNREERDKSYIAKDKNGKQKNTFVLYLGRVPKELRDKNGNIVTDDAGNIRYVVKKNKDGTDKFKKVTVKTPVMGPDGKQKTDANGKPVFNTEIKTVPVYETRPYTDEERMGRVITNEEGYPVYVTKKNKDGTVKTDKNGEIVYAKRKHTRQEIDKKIKEAAKILGIEEYLDRKPKAMSGGQRQRVALGRAIVRAPKVFLLDEPLSNLDAKLRAAMRSEISKLHHKLQTTFIYVTHDQVEAMTMGTRIVVMKDGFVQQIDTPRNLYSYPCNKFVAGFIGTPQMNFYDCKMLLSGDNVHIQFEKTGTIFDVPYKYFTKTDRDFMDGDKSIILGIRAEHISVDANKYPFKAKCRISFAEDLGTECQLYADFNLNSEESIAESPTRIIIKAPVGREYNEGDVIEVSLDFDNVHLFDARSEMTVSPRIPTKTTVECKVTQKTLSFLGANINLPPAINVEDGEYFVDIPTAAVTVGGDVNTEVVKSEIINGKNLLHLKFENRILFALGEAGSAYKEGDKITVSIDTKMLGIFKSEKIAGNAIKKDNVVSPLNLENSLVGFLQYERVVVNEETQEKKNKFFYYLTETKGIVGGKTKDKEKLNLIKLECPYAIGERLASSGGRSIFKGLLKLGFTPYQVDLSRNLIKAKVIEILDYGKEKFVKAMFGDSSIIIAVDKDFNQDEILFGLDAEVLTVTEPNQGIRLV